MSKLKKSEKDKPSEQSTGQRRLKAPKLPKGFEHPRATEFKGYDLTNLPLDALPRADFVYKGKHSYTVNIETAEP